jgi:hypothetical protein
MELLRSDPECGAAVRALVGLCATFGPPLPLLLLAEGKHSCEMHVLSALPFVYLHEHQDHFNHMIVTV